MPGSPKKAAMLAELERRTRTEFPDEADATHLDYVCRWQAEGKLAIGLARELGVSWELLRDYLYRKFGHENTATKLSRAREAGAYILVEESLELADEATEDNVQVKRLQVQTTQWVAEKWNARELGSKQQAGTVINIGTLMLDALRQPPPPNPFAIASVIVEDAQLVSAEDSTTCKPE
jgi:hypothetical protein